jgi:hypothetical protein
MAHSSSAASRASIVAAISPSIGLVATGPMEARVGRSPQPARAVFNRKRSAS